MNSLKRVCAFQIELDYESVLVRGKNRSTRRNTNNKLNPQVTSTPAFEPRPHW